MSSSLDLVSSLVERALRSGATDAEAVFAEGDEFSVNVRMGEVETLVESGSRAVGLRVFFGQQQASSTTSDLTEDGLSQLIAGAISLAQLTEEDPFAGLPDASEFGSLEGNLKLSSDDVYSLSSEERIQLAKRAEDAAFAYDPRISNSGGASFDAATGLKAMANSRGFAGEYRSSYAGIGVVPLAKDEKSQMQRAYWGHGARRLSDLESPEELGAEAARRTLARLGARRVKTQQAPIIFAPEAAQSILGHIFTAARGDAIWRSASFLAGKLDTQIANANITVIDDHTMMLPTGMGGFGTTPFDGEGLRSRRNVLVEDGVLKTYLLNTYAARKLGMQSTANAARGLAGAPGIGAGNLYLTAQQTIATSEILRNVESGLYVTSLMGQGVNMVTGDYSRGATGLWIENGELTHAVEEITIAGNLAEMFLNITAIGDDLRWRSSIAAPTLRIDGMTIAGE